MDIEQFDTPEMAELRQEVRRWATANSPGDWQKDAGDEEKRMALFAKCTTLLGEAGYLVPHWPVEFGGPGYTIAEQMVVRQELKAANFPPVGSGIGVHHAAATLMMHGTPEQQKHIPAIKAGEAWCQGFSEPNAGSDLASLTTSAILDGDVYIVNGQKIWSSGAHHSSWCLLLARTDPSAKKHRGISVFMLDLSLPGVEVRPIRQATGETGFAEIFLTDVRLPVDCRIGPENEGWRLAQTTLSTERGAFIADSQVQLANEVERLYAEAAETICGNGAPLLDQPGVRLEFAQSAAEVEVLGMLVERALKQLVRHGEMGPEGSILKLYFSTTREKLTARAARLRGMAAVEALENVGYFNPDSGSINDHVRSWHFSISAGSDEIQRNIIAERMLGLPREPIFN